MIALTHTSGLVWKIRDSVPIRRTLNQLRVKERLRKSKSRKQNEIPEHFLHLTS